eukprot:7289890-Pyramimonas_sp.AAC.3
MPAGWLLFSGWTEAMQLMKEGDKWELFIPSGRYSLSVWVYHFMRTWYQGFWSDRPAIDQRESVSLSIHVSRCDVETGV